MMETQKKISKTTSCCYYYYYYSYWWSRETRVRSLSSCSPYKCVLSVFGVQREATFVCVWSEVSRRNESRRRQERGGRETRRLFLSAKKRTFALFFRSRIVLFFALPLWFRKRDGNRRSETKLIKLKKSSSHKTHTSHIPHIYLFKRYANCAQKWLTLFSHAEHIHERFSNVVLASFDSRLSSLVVLRARLEKGKILGGWRKRKHFMPPHPHGTSARFLPRCERFLERKERKCRRDVLVASRFKS